MRKAGEAHRLMRNGPDDFQNGESDRLRCKSVKPVRVAPLANRHHLVHVVVGGRLVEDGFNLVHLHVVFRRQTIGGLRSRLRDAGPASAMPSSNPQVGLRISLLRCLLTVRLLGGDTHSIPILG